MELDLLYEIDAPKPWGDKPHPWGQREVEQRAYKEMLQQIRLADQVGFNIAWFVEHHFREGRSHCPAPEVVLGALTQITERLKLGFGVTLLPYGFTHPARVAEKVATADILSGGRVEWGTGRSTPMEQTAFHVDYSQTRAQWEEAIQVVTGMWRSEYFEWDSPTFQFPKRMVTPKPVQDPHPPCWSAAVSDDTAAFVGRHQLGMLSLSIMQPLDKLAQKVKMYRDAWSSPEAKPLADFPNDRVAAYTLVHCADTMQQAVDNGIWESVGWWYRNIAEFTLEWEFPHVSQEERDRMFPGLMKLMDGDLPVSQFDEADMIVVGDPERCIEKLKKYADIGVDEVICYVQFGYNSGESVLKTIELLGKEVLPEIQKYVPARIEVV
jgi:alkanesulfonate monooxygenase SsuD/methylene tetrahydromethanopterin reductase-like flavin-dependent oxidoreductase (luciferase family)